MREIFKSTLLLIPILGFCQNWNPTEFENSVLSMTVVQRENVTDYDLALAKVSLEGTQRATGGKVENFNALDYWNLAIALYRLQEPEEKIILALEKMAEKEKGCQLLDELKYDTSLYSGLKNDYDKILQSCGPINADNTPFNIDTYIKQNNLDESLTRLMAQLEEKDQSVRKQLASDEKMIAMSHQNMKAIDSIFQTHGDYIGKSRVGDKYAHIMWLVIQHSDIETMKRYLPIILIAVKKKELKPTPVKLLIDRIYGVEFGYQIFGTQPGVNIAPENIRTEAMNKFGIE